MIPRRDRYQFRQRLSDIFVHFQLPVLPSAIEQSFLSKRLKPTHDPHGGCGNTSQHRGDVVRSRASFIEKNDLDAGPKTGVFGLPHGTLQSPLHGAWQSHYNTLVHLGLPDGAASQRRENPEALLLETNSKSNPISRKEKITYGDPESRFLI